MASASSDEERSEQGGDEAQPALLAWLQERYLAIDPRALGMGRIYLALLLLCDLLRRSADTTMFYSNEGVLSNHFLHFAPLAKPLFTIYTAFITPREVKLAFFLTGLCYLWLLVGYRTRLAQVVALVLCTSLGTRNLFLESSGSVALNLLCAWTVFLPLGARFSLDAVLASLRGRDERKASALEDREALAGATAPHHGVAVLGLTLQVAAIYLVDALQKTGPTWRDGEAFHLLLWQNRIVTSVGAFVRAHEPAWLSPLLTPLAIAVGIAAPLLLLSPVAQAKARSAFVAITVLFQLAVACLFSLGVLPWAFVGFALFVVPASSIERLSARLARGLEARVLVYDVKDPLAHLVARVLARLDAYGQLSFVDVRDDERVPEGAPKKLWLGCYHPGKKAYTQGAAAVVSALRSTPSGRFFAPVLSMWPFSALLRAVLQRRAEVAASLGLEAGLREGEKGPAAVLGDGPSPLLEQVLVTAQAIRESLSTVLLLAVLLQLGEDNPTVPVIGQARQLRFLKPLIDYPRLSQGFRLFAPDAPKRDGMLVVEGTTVDGRKLDPFTGAAPDFEAPLHGPHLVGQQRCDYFFKIALEGNKAYRDELKRYLLSYQQLHHRPVNERLVSAELYWVSADAPAVGGEPSNVQRQLLGSGR